MMLSTLSVCLSVCLSQTNSLSLLWLYICMCVCVCVCARVCSCVYFFLVMYVLNMFYITGHVTRLVCYIRTLTWLQSMQPVTHTHTHPCTHTHTHTHTHIYIMLWHGVVYTSVDYSILTLIEVLPEFDPLMELDVNKTGHSIICIICHYDFIR